MAKKRATGNTVVKSIIVLILIVAALAAVCFCSWYFTGGGWLGGKVPPTFTVTVGEEEHSKSFSQQLLYSGTEFEVNRPFGEDYTIEIAATQTSNVMLQSGESTVKWSELKADFNKGFEIVKDGNRFTVNYTSFEDIVTKATGLEQFEISGETSDELFQMKITCAHAEMKINFGVSFPVEGIEIDPDHVIFGGKE